MCHSTPLQEYRQHPGLLLFFLLQLSGPLLLFSSWRVPHQIPWDPSRAVQQQDLPCGLPALSTPLREFCSLRVSETTSQLQICFWHVVPSKNNTRLINCTNYYISRGKEKLRHHFLSSLFIDCQAGAATLVFSRAACRHFPRHSEELTALSTSANIALRFLNRRKEPAARWEACEGTHPLARTGRCLVNRRQKEGQSRQRKQPAVSHFLTQIIWLGTRHTSIQASFPRFQSQGKPIVKSKTERQKASRQNCSAPSEVLK